jgi:hypothetical protein
VGEDADDRPVVDPPGRDLGGEVGVRPGHDHLGRVRKAFAGGEYGTRVADGDLVAEKGSDRGDGGGEVDGAEDEQPGRGREGLYEDGQVVAATLAVGPVSSYVGHALLEHAPRVIDDGHVETDRAQRSGDRVRSDQDPRADRPRPGDDRGAGDRPLAGDRLVDRLEFGKSAGGDRFDEDVDDPAAGQPHCEGVIVTHAVALEHRNAAADDLLGKFVDRTLDAAAGHAADRHTVCRHGHRGARQPRRAAERGDDGRGRTAATAAAPVEYVGQDLTHDGVPGAASLGGPSDWPRWRPYPRYGVPTGRSRRRTRAGPWAGGSLTGCGACC